MTSGNCYQLCRSPAAAGLTHVGVCVSEVPRGALCPPFFCGWVHQAA